MSETMTPSKLITDGQIDKAVDFYRAMLQKHRTEIGSEQAQQVLGQSDYVAELVAVLRRRVEAVSGMIVRIVSVDRTRSPQEVIKATGRAKYVDDEVVSAMPRGEGETAEVIFFKLGRYVSDAKLEEEYKLRGLKPVDPYSLAQVNTDDLAFGDDRPNSTYWKDADGKWCFAAFDRWLDSDRRVIVDRSGSGWGDDWWFAGARK